MAGGGWRVAVGQWQAGGRVGSGWVCGRLLQVNTNVGWWWMFAQEYRVMLLHMHMNMSADA